MRFIRQDLISDQELSDLPIMDIAFVGSSDIDERSNYSARQSSKLGKKKLSVRYNPELLTLTVGRKDFRANSDGLEDLARNHKAASIVIDATTLDFAEIALLLYAYSFAEKKPRVGFLYVEPLEYVRSSSVSPAVNGALFDLSDGFVTKSIPPFAPMLNSQSHAHLVAFLGFEGSRLSSAISADDGQFIRRISVVFGIPPFQATWDLEAFMANSRLLSQRDVSVKFCGANNPKAAYEILTEAYNALTLNSECNRLMISPFGTKPMAIGAALYCTTHRNSRVLFDHPQRKQGRTKGIHCTHWYEVNL